MSFYNQLQSATGQTRQYLLDAPVIKQVMNEDFTLETYIAFLNQAFHHVKHTIPLLMLAGARLTASQSWLLPVLSNYIQEEIGHEQWILDDIAACGFDRDEFEFGTAPVATDIMVSYLYDYIHRKNALGVFGMVQVLEATSSSLAPAVAQIVKRKLSLPESAMTYLTTHGELDQDHIRFFEQAMNNITDPQDQNAIIDAANKVYRLYGNVYRDIPSAAVELNKRAAA